MSEVYSAAKTTSLTIKSDPVSSPNDSALTETPKYSDAAKAKVMLEKHPLSAPKVSSPLYRALLDYSKEVAIILHTVNDEYWAVMDRLLAPQSDTIPALGTPLTGSITFPTKGMVLGRFGGYKVAVVQTNMGAECRDEIEVVLERFPNAQAIIGVGVAYGARLVSYPHPNVRNDDHRLQSRTEGLGIEKWFQCDEMLLHQSNCSDL